MLTWSEPRWSYATVLDLYQLGLSLWRKLVAWLQMHRGPGAGSVSRSATEYGRQHDITVIDGGCPCMFNPTADPGHKAMRFVLTLTGKVPRKV